MKVFLFFNRYSGFYVGWTKDKNIVNDILKVYEYTRLVKMNTKKITKAEKDRYITDEYEMYYDKNIQQWTNIDILSSFEETYYGPFLDEAHKYVMNDMQDRQIRYLRETFKIFRAIFIMRASLYAILGEYYFDDFTDFDSDIADINVIKPIANGIVYRDGDYDDISEAYSNYYITEHINQKVFYQKYVLDS